MTLLEDRRAQDRAPSGPSADMGSPPPSTSAPSGPPPLQGRTIGAGAGLTVVLIVALFLGFVAYLLAFSGLAEARSQHALRQSLQRSLAAATAPVHAVREGRPVAVLDVPQIGLRDAIVVQGTSTRDLMAGPGHLPSTPLPGQAGTVAIFGKRTTFGAPFASLLKLQIGDTIHVTTGQGVSTYRVSSFGDLDRPAPANSVNRLLLVTGSYSAGHAIVVSADLTSRVQPSSGVLPGLAPEDEPGVRDVAASIIPLAAWSQALLLAIVAVTVVWQRRATRWPLVLCGLPLLLAITWCVYENAAGLLVNLY